MNWDWEKLQQKRQRQSGGKTPPNRDGQEPPRPPFGNFDFNKYKPKFRSGIPIFPLIALIITIFLASGIFFVTPGEIGVVTRFGEFNRTVGEGPHYHIPLLEGKNVVQVQYLRIVRIGESQSASRHLSQSLLEESSMFTGDENILHMQFTVQYDLGTMENAHENAPKFLFNVNNPSHVVRMAAEAAMREVVGSNSIDAILSSDRTVIEDQTKSILQHVLNTYDIGVSVRGVQLLDVQPPIEVAAAFKDVASAREDKQTITNQAEAYRNDIVPRATGTANSLINTAEAYSRQTVLNAEGESEKFLAIANEFSKAQDITMKRLQLEAIGEILSSSGIEKIIMSKDTKGSLIPFMNIDKAPGGIKAGPISIDSGRAVR